MSTSPAPKDPRARRTSDTTAPAQAPVVANLTVTIRSDGSVTFDVSGVKVGSAVPIHVDGQPHPPASDSDEPSSPDDSPGQPVKLTRELVGPTTSAVDMAARTKEGHRSTVGHRIWRRELLGCKLAETGHAWILPLWQFANGSHGALAAGLADALHAIRRKDPTEIVTWFVTHRLPEGRTPKDLLAAGTEHDLAVLLEEARRFAQDEDSGEHEAAA